MAAAGAFSSISSSGFYINPEDEASELEFLIQKNIVARLGRAFSHRQYVCSSDDSGFWIVKMMLFVTRRVCTLFTDVDDYATILMC